MKYFFAIAFSAMLLITSCGEEIDQIREVADNAKKMSEGLEKAEKSMSEAEKRMQERREKGDTTAMPYKELQEFLPGSIAGYSEPKLSGEQMSMGNFSMSNAEAVYKKEDGKGEINIKIVDYLENYGMYQGFLAAFGNYSRENDDGFERSFDPGYEHVWAREKYNNKNNRAEVSMGVGYRFMIEMKQRDAEGTDMLKDIMEQMPIKKMANM